MPVFKVFLALVLLRLGRRHHHHIMLLLLLVLLLHRVEVLWLRRLLVPNRQHLV